MILSVLIPTRDKVDMLDQTLTALCEQDVGGVAWEIVVVDDASSDRTWSALQSWRQRTGGRVRPLRAERNLGRAGARNLAARAAKGTYLLFIDDDIVAPVGLLAAHLRVLESGPGRGTIGRAVTAPALVDAPHFRYLDTRAIAKLAPGPAPARYFVTQNAAVPREAFLAVGGFSERFGTYGFEDMEVGFRLEDAGVRFVALTEPVPEHVHHHTLDDYLEKKRECGRDSLRRIAALHPARLAEMRLDLVIDPPGRAPRLLARAFRGLTDGPVGELATWLVGHWPCARGFRPRAWRCYERAMDFAVLTSYRRGLRELGPSDVDPPS
jgi:glycosyltransferase involved in cell wall biosynthesis